MSQEDLTDEMPGRPDRPTEVNPVGEEPTDVIPAGNENPTETIPEGNENPTETMDGGTDDPTEVRPAGSSGGGRGIGILVASIVASLALVGAYVVAGGPVGPDKAADPCKERPWTDPQDLEEAAQQFALSASDGAACELGVSREELIRSIADDQTRQAFMEEHGFSESDLEDALRAGLNRAADDAENAGVLTGLAATGVRAAIKVMPMSVMIGLLENADSIFAGDFGSLGGFGDVIETITGGLDSLGSDGDDDPLGGLGDALQGALPEGTTDALEGVLPEDRRQQLEEQAKDKLKQGLDDLLGP